MDAGDHIGTESYLDMKSDHEADLLPRTANRCLPALPARRQKKKGKEFPPPLTCISQNENLKRYYTADGRLVIREEKSNYLRARRENGRLTLELVSSNKDFIPEGKGNAETPVKDVDCKIDGVDEVMSNGVVDRTGVIGGAKCYTRYKRWGAFDIGARAMRPVLI